MEIFSVMDVYSAVQTQWLLPHLFFAFFFVKGGFLRCASAPPDETGANADTWGQSGKLNSSEGGVNVAF